VNSDTVGIVHNRTENAKDEEQLKSEATLRKVKHMQKILQKEGLSNKTMNENIETFEEVPAYIRRNMSLGDTEKPSESKLSRFTLTSDDEEGPVLRENNAYLNDNVD
jgi:cell division protein FtsZ